MTPCEQTDALVAPYVDGALDADEAEAFALHLASCAACRDALHDALQLVAVEASQPTQRSEPAPIAALPSRAARARARRWGGRTRWLVVGALAVAAVVTVVLVIPRGPATDAVALASAPVRTLEGRVSYAEADHHRDYAIARAGGSASAEAVPLDALARLEDRGDRHGVAAGYLLMGDAKHAEGYLDAKTDSPDVAADRALVLLVTGHPDDALVALDAVLAGAPKHPQALWNRALALRDLGLARMASEAFTQVAWLGEPGWAAEATARAAALRDEADQRKARYTQVADAGRLLATAPGGISAELARQIPGSTRGFFDEAVRTAASVEAVRGLAPLAVTLDAIAGDSTASARIARAAGDDWAKRAPLAARYASVTEGVSLSLADVQALLVALREAHEDDLVLGTLVRAFPAGLTSDQLTELQRVAGASGDSWDRMTALGTAARSMLARDPALVSRFRPALAACTPKVEVWCARLELLLADGYLATNKLPDARTMIVEGLARVRRGNEDALESMYLARVVKLEVARPALARAYRDELTRRTR